MKLAYCALALSVLMVACGPSMQEKASQAGIAATEIAQGAETSPEDWLKARELATTAYEAGYQTASMAGIIGKSMLLGSDSDTAAADSEPYLLEAVDEDPSLHWYLAKGYENGWYGEIDKARGCEQYIAAAEAKLNGAYWPAGICYVNGTGVDKDELAGFEWMTKSANAGDQNGMVSLAVLYATGQGTQKDAQLAATWYETAIRTAGPNRAQALRGIGALHLFGELEDSIAQRGYAFLELASEAGDTVAPRLLGRVAELDETQREAVNIQKEFLTNFYQLREVPPVAIDSETTE